MRIDERAVLAMSSRTNKQVQPFTPVPDADVDLPNFDQWLNPSIEAPVSSQKVPAIIDDELDAELTMNDADPTTPFYMFVHAGHRRLGEVGHYVRRITKGRFRRVRFACAIYYFCGTAACRWGGGRAQQRWKFLRKRRRGRRR